MRPCAVQQGAARPGLQLQVLLHALSCGPGSGRVFANVGLARLLVPWATKRRGLTCVVSNKATRLRRLRSKGNVRSSMVSVKVFYSLSRTYMP